jgi:hypothetical protein
MKNQCLQDEGVDCSSRRMGAFPKSSLSSQRSFLEELDMAPMESSKICEWMEVEILSNVKFFKLYPRGREARTTKEPLDISDRN